jgi:signal-transduction protein with cAMP-binding, CBS, and nucleotidyltransferase domain
LSGLSAKGIWCGEANCRPLRTRSWWLDLFASEQGLAQDFIKSHAVKVADIMTRDVITVGPEASLSEVARLLEKHAIKRVPVVNNRQLVGIISRANLVQALASLEAKPHLQLSPTDAEIRNRIVRRLEDEPWAHTSLLNVLVNDGIVDLWGIVHTSVEKNAVRVAAEATEGVRAVNDHLVLRPIESGT